MATLMQTIGGTIDGTGADGPRSEGGRRILLGLSRELWIQNFGDLGSGPTSGG